MKRMFQEVLRGNGLTSIAKGPNSDGVPSARGKNWSKTSIYQILTNEAYTGTLLWSKTSKKDLTPIRVENAWPGVVDKEIFNKAQLLLEARSPKQIHPRRITSPYLFSGLAKCGCCGKSLVGQDAKSGKCQYYVCSSLLKKGAGACSTRRLNRNRFEHIVIDELKKRVLTRDNLVELVKLVNDELDNEVSEFQTRLESVSNELRDMQGRLDKLYEALETGKVQLDDLAPRIKEIRIRQAVLELNKLELESKLSDRHVELTDKNEVETYVSDLHELLSGAEITEKKVFIRGFVKELTVTNDEVKMLYTMPIFEDVIPDEESVLPIVHNGGRLKIRTSDPSLIRTVL